MHAYIPSVVGICTFQSDSSPGSGSGDVHLLPGPVSQGEHELTAPGRATASKHTVQRHSRVEECDVGTLDITGGWGYWRRGNEELKRVSPWFQGKKVVVFKG